MKNSEKILKTLSNLLENGILTTKDIKKEFSTNFKFKKDKIINKQLKKIKKIKKAKKS